MAVIFTEHSLELFKRAICIFIKGINIVITNAYIMICAPEELYNHHSPPLLFKVGGKLYSLEWVE